MRARPLALFLAILGIAFAAFVEYGTTRASDVDRSFALFVFEAGPWALLLVLVLLTRFTRTLVVIAFILFALDLYAYFTVFVLPNSQSSAVIYLYKPFYGLALVAAGVLAGFLVARANAPGT